MNALGIYSQDGDRLTFMDFRWNVPQVRKRDYDHVFTELWDIYLDVLQHKTSLDLNCACRNASRLCYMTG
jgi:hypothetical protein